jgi:hypothetical protein
MIFVLNGATMMASKFFTRTVVTIQYVRIAATRLGRNHEKWLSTTRRWRRVYPCMALPHTLRLFSTFSAEVRWTSVKKKKKSVLVKSAKWIVLQRIWPI